MTMFHHEIRQPPARRSCAPAARRRGSRGCVPFLLLAAGLCLFPQAGVAIGLAMVVQGSSLFVDAPGEVREMLRLLTNVVLFSVFVNELIGPLISRFGIVRGAARL